MNDDKILESRNINSSKPISREKQLSSPKRRESQTSIFDIKRYLREPLVLFLLIGLLLFVAYSVLNPNKDKEVSLNQIVLTENDLRQLYIAFTAKWQRPPTSEEMARLVNTKVSEEILYREALALGLDKDDTIVKRRMAQKMDFLMEDLSDLSEPSTDELKLWFKKNSQQFELPDRVTFRHLYFSPDRRNGNEHDAASEVLKKIVGEPGDSPLAASLADPFMFHDYYGDRTPEQVTKEFGPDFADSLFLLKPGSWSGPIMSGYGWHLVWIDSVTPGHIPYFEEVEPEVRTAWTEEKRSTIKRNAFETIRSRYQIVLPESYPQDELTNNVSKYGAKQ